MPNLNALIRSSFEALTPALLMTPNEEILKRVVVLLWDYGLSAKSDGLIVRLVGTSTADKLCIRKSMNSTLIDRYQSLRSNVDDVSLLRWLLINVLVFLVVPCRL